MIFNVYNFTMFEWEKPDTKEYILYDFIYKVVNILDKVVDSTILCSLNSIRFLTYASDHTAPVILCNQPPQNLVT